jgi:acetoacetyl-CoA synthetase
MNPSPQCVQLVHARVDTIPPRLRSVNFNVDNSPRATYRETYFATFPGVWRHGDWIRVAADGVAVIYGRSDSTINRGGIRMGSAEIYRAALTVDSVQDALVVDVPDRDDAGEAWMPMFVVVADGRPLTPEAVKTVRDRIRSECSPRHVPDDVIAVPEIPRTLSGKILEVPVKRLLMGEEPDKVVSRDALANPSAFDWFVSYAARAGARCSRQAAPISAMKSRIRGLISRSNRLPLKTP